MNIGDTVKFIGRISNLPTHHVGKNDISKILNYGIGKVKEINVFGKKTLISVHFDGCVFQDTIISNKYLSLVGAKYVNKKDNTI